MLNFATKNERMFFDGYIKGRMTRESIVPEWNIQLRQEMTSRSFSIFCPTSMKFR